MQPRCRDLTAGARAWTTCAAPRTPAGRRSWGPSRWLGCLHRRKGEGEARPMVQRLVQPMPQSPCHWVSWGGHLRPSADSGCLPGHR